MLKALGALTVSLAIVAAPAEYARRVDAVRTIPGFVALWDFVTREPGPAGRFAAHQAPGDSRDFHLDAANYVRDYWAEGRPATYDDFPLLGEGPFGEAVQFRDEGDPSFRPVLLVPRTRLHDSGLDVKGPNRSVSMVAWVRYETGNHAIAGIWHEGTDLREARHTPALRVEPGMRQYALFAGLAANSGASAAHVSENGASSFGDKYARNLSVTPERLSSGWNLVGFTFDNDADVVTSYIDDVASEYWIDQPASHPFFKWPAAGWQQAYWRGLPGLQDGEDPAFPEAQFYTPPETSPILTELLVDGDDERVEVRTYDFTRVRVTRRRTPGGTAWHDVNRELVGLKVNPFWFGHDLHAPATLEAGGPFTIGRVIHTSRSVGVVGAIGGVAVFGRALTRAEMATLAAIAKAPPLPTSP